MTASAPRFSVARRTAVTMSPSREENVSSAPAWRALSRFSGLRPATSTRQPLAFKAWTSSSAIGPAPSTATVSPALQPVASTPCTAQASGSESAAVSKARAAGSFQTLCLTMFAGTRSYSA